MDGELVISRENELIAQAMLQTRGDLAKASRFDSVPHNAMALRRVVKENPDIRARYHALLADEMQDPALVQIGRQNLERSGSLVFAQARRVCQIEQQLHASLGAIDVLATRSAATRKAKAQFGHGDARSWREP